MKLLLHWLKQCRRFWALPQSHPEYLRTRTRQYRLRIERVKDFWITGGLLMLVSGHPAFILGLSLFLTFLSFAYLEEES